MVNWLTAQYKIQTVLSTFGIKFKWQVFNIDKRQDIIVISEVISPRVILNDQAKFITIKELTYQNKIYFKQKKQNGTITLNYPFYILSNI